MPHFRRFFFALLKIQHIIQWNLHIVLKKCKKYKKMYYERSPIKFKLLNFWFSATSSFKFSSLELEYTCKNSMPIKCCFEIIVFLL